METFIPKGNVRGFIMPDFIFRHTELSLGAKMLYALLCNYAGERDHCWPSHTTLATKLGCSVSSIKVYLKQLVGQKLIASGDTDINKNRVRSCMYYFLRPFFSKASSSALSAQNFLRPCSQNLTTPRSESDYNLNLIERKTNNPPLPPKPAPKPYPSGHAKPHRRRGGFSSVNASFEEFYALYPKKEGKELARSVWHSLHCKGLLPPTDTLHAAITRAMATEQWQKEYGRYIPMPSNFLRGQRWKDTEEAQDIAVHVSTQHAEHNRAIEARFTQENAQNTEKMQSLRPIFNKIATRFSCKNTAPAMGLWVLLYEKGIAPTEKDIPDNAQNLNLFHWLQKYQYTCKQAR